MSALPGRTEVLVVGAGPVGWRLPPRWSGMAMTSRWLIGRRRGRSRARSGCPVRFGRVIRAVIPAYPSVHGKSQPG
jgi:hypothetical protein